MKNVKILWVSTILIFYFAVSCQAQGWRGIRPLHSTREDVERLIGPPMRPNDSVYDLKGERVSITYSGASCAKDWPYGWNVPAGTVVAIRISPQPRPKLTELQIDLSTFRKFVDPSGFAHYTNADEGLTVEVDENEHEVRVIEYYPAASDDHLRCAEAAERERKIEKGESEVRWPDVYYRDTSLEKKQVYLDYFADLLKKSPPDSMVYIIGYAGRRARVGEAQTRANFAKDYLTQKRGVDSRQIVTIDGGYRDPAGVDLYVVRLGQAKPLSVPNIYPGNVEIIKDKGKNQRRQHHAFATRHSTPPLETRLTRKAGLP